MSGLLAIPDIMEPDLGSPETTDGDGGHRDRWQIQVKHYTRPTHSLAANLNAAANIYSAAPRRRTLGNATERHTNRTERPGGTTPRARPASAMPSLSTDSATELQRTCVRLTGLTGGTGLSDRSDLSRRPRTSSAARPISAGGQYELEAMLRRPMSAVRPMPPRPSTASRQRGGLADPLALFGYETLGPIASGSFSQVVRARQTDSGREVAVKSWTRAKLARAPHHGVEWLPTLALALTRTRTRTLALALALILTLTLTSRGDEGGGGRAPTAAAEPAP